MESKTLYLNMPLEIKEAHVDEDRNVGRFEGLGSVFDVEDLGGDVVVKGAFSESLKKRRPVMLWQHDIKQPIGVFTKAEETDKGLYLEGEINLDVEKGREAYALMKQGAISGLSIGYFVEDYEDKKGVRYLKKLSLHEVSIVTFPMNEMATVASVKSISTIRDFEQVMREIGFSRQEAKTIASCGYNALHREDGATAENLRDAAALKAALEQLESGISALTKNKSR